MARFSRISTGGEALFHLKDRTLTVSRFGTSFVEIEVTPTERAGPEDSETQIVPAIARPGAQPDRQVTSWVLANGGSFVTGTTRTVTQSEEIPDSFTIQAVVVTTDAPVDMSILQLLSQLDSLTRLEVFAPNWNAPEVVAELAKCRKLERLSAYGQPADNVRVLGTMTSLSWLNLSFSRLSDEHLAMLAELSNLEVLNLAKTSITGHGLQHLRACTKLTSLDLGSTDVTSEGLQSLQYLPQLQSLDLRRAQLKGDQYSVLHHCPNLSDLTLLLSTIDDAGLEQIADLKILTTLDLRSTQVTEAGVEKLRAALPNCSVKWEEGVVETAEDGN